MATVCVTTGGRVSVLAYKLVAARRYWRPVFVGSLVTPMLYVLALGVGLGSVVDHHHATGASLGVPYLQFVAPAFLTAAAMQIGANDATFPITAGFKWQRFYHGMAATPLTPNQICDGELLYIALRVLVSAASYLAIVACFGGAHCAWVLLTVPIAVLTGMAFATPIAAVAASVQREGNLFNVLSRFVLTPLFLFSGTFYPISRLPEWGQVLAHVSPLWHGVQLARAAALGDGLPVWAALGHLTYLLALFGGGLALARWRFRVRLSR